ncbi:zeaxanthin epoxidase, chloroplastic isoform X1 [Amborella trichopoda]|uniref:zeaxanthin epoxidase, chloroplastic isoform X1 n=1 Tax=Amborella trichopoda TaxID=13333 RepID=UPI0009BE9E0D|nr:zeaxanthin epoxidase, chloroplastic isoform X1 [Amborella trichopoda]|eukprot:XP_020526424.1 zeaxanthin epoxidase, chloroplastic isoform X1 [Amborella trichopoda]
MGTRIEKARSSSSQRKFSTLSMASSLGACFGHYRAKFGGSAKLEGDLGVVMKKARVLNSEAAGFSLSFHGALMREHWDTFGGSLKLEEDSHERMKKNPRVSRSSRSKFHGALQLEQLASQGENNLMKKQNGNGVSPSKLEKNFAKGVKKPRILIAGGGIGGLVLALAAKNRGFDVMVFERNLSAVRGEGRYRGSIQLQSNALAVLQAIDKKVAERVMDAGCVNGNRINGMIDGISGEWFVRYDYFTPAAERGLPLTRVISRITLQKILMDAVGPDVVYNMSNVVDFTDDGTKVTAILSNGQQYEGDVLVGADGIWSKVRGKLFGKQDVKYSSYTCYSGLTEFVPPDNETVGYRVFLGYKQFFVTMDVGDGKTQWYAFHYEPPGNSDPPEGKKRRLLQLFGNWCNLVVDLLHKTPETTILRRDIYEIDMLGTWSKGHVTLLGDAAHAMQPNLGQGGCMAIEDCYQLIIELEKAAKLGFRNRLCKEIPYALKRYESKRMLRVGILHSISRLAADSLSFYHPYFDVGLGTISVKNHLLFEARHFVQFGLSVMMDWITAGNR